MLPGLKHLDSLATPSNFSLTKHSYHQIVNIVQQTHHTITSLTDLTGHQYSFTGGTLKPGASSRNGTVSGRAWRSR